MGFPEAREPSASRAKSPSSGSNWLTLGKLTLVAFAALAIAKPVETGNRVQHRDDLVTKRPLFPGRFAPRWAYPAPDGGHNDSDTDNDDDDESSICTDPVCIQMDNIIMDSLASSLNGTVVDPCTDFYSFTCQGWEARHPIPETEASITLYSELDKVTWQVLKGILESPYQLSNESFTQEEKDADLANFQKMKNAYTACMDMTALKNAGITPLKDVVEEFATVFPVAGPKPSKQELTDAILWLAKNGVSAVVNMIPRSDDKFTNNMTVFLQSGYTGLPAKNYYTTESITSMYTSSMAEMFANVFGNGPGTSVTSTAVNATSSYQQGAANVLAFETRVVNAKMPRADNYNVIKYYNPMPVEQVGFTEVDLAALLAGLLPEGMTLNRIINMDPSFFTAMNGILADTDRETLFWYFSWGLINAWAGRLHPDYAKPVIRITNALTGLEPDVLPDRENLCLVETDKLTGWIVSKAYVDVAFSPEAKAYGELIVDSVKEVVRETLQKADWMSPATKAVAIQKLDNMKRKIGYPDTSPNVQSPLQLQEWYRDLNLTSNSYFNNGRSYGTFNRKLIWNRLSKPTDKNVWIMSAATVNAYYLPPTNEIGVPAAILQPPVFAFGNGVPEYLSYGSFGWVAGHEITHGFDSSGSQYDQDGNYNDWWDPATVANFNERTQCFIDQYDNFVMPRRNETLKVNGELTQGENIADAGGLVGAYKAWKLRAKADPSRNLRLPRLSQKFTKEQIFFLSAALGECGAFRPEEEDRYLALSVHAPGYFRINGAIMENSSAFRKAFNCPKLDPLPGSNSTSAAKGGKGGNGNSKYAPRCELW